MSLKHLMPGGWLRALLAFLLAGSVVQPALGADRTATVDRYAAKTGSTQVDGKFISQNLVLTVRIDKTIPEADLGPIRDYFAKATAYSFVSDWPSVTGVTPLSGDNPPFTPTANPVVKAIATEGSNWRFDVVLPGVLPRRARGEIHVSQPAAGLGWALKVSRGNGNGSGPVIVRYSLGETDALAPFRGHAAFGYGSGGASVDFSGEGIIQQPRGKERSAFTTLSVDGKLPLGKPFDVDGITGAKDRASKENPDALTFSLNRYKYRPGGHLEVLGVHGRVTGAFEGGEAVVYYQPFMGWKENNRFFYALETEAGWRDNTEFTNLRTRSADRGNFVGRVGGVVEWAPRLGPVNRNLTKGVRFFVRGRAWLDTFDNDHQDTDVRLRYYLDSELFYDFSDQWRIFLRSEYGFIPPDLNRQISRPVFAGVGKAF